MIKIRKNVIRSVVRISIWVISLAVLLWIIIWKPFSRPVDISTINIPNNQISGTGNWNFDLYENNCNFQYTGDYKYLDIATPSNRIYTKEKFDVLNFTKTIQISWNIDNIWLCIIADISDKSASYSAYRKKNSYYGMVYVYFNLNNMGYVNVAYYKPSGQYYDAKSDSTHILGDVFDGKFWSSETPKKFLLNLNSIAVANTEDWFYKNIFPDKLFKNGSVLNVWWFMAPLTSKAYRASSISSYRLIYKWDWEITFK